MTSLDASGPVNEPHIEPPAASRKKPRKQHKGHRGVRIIEPTGPKSPHWRVRYKDGDSGKIEYKRIPLEMVGDASLRKEYAVGLHRQHVRKREDIAAGATPNVFKNTVLADAFKEYFETWGATKRDATRESYERGRDLFLAWCALPKIDIRKTRELSRGALRSYAGSRAAALFEGHTRAAPTVNKELKWLSAVLKELRTMELIGLSEADIKDGLRLLKENIKKRAFYRCAQLRAILDACRRHDAIEYNGEFSGRLFPVVLFLLLTGMRPDEAIWIEWGHLVTDDDGKLLIRVPAEIAKNGKERFISTRHSPLLAHLLSSPTGHKDYIVGGTEHSLYDARHKAIDKHDAPAFVYKQLRVTCGTYLACAPSIFRAAASTMAAAQLGHCERIAEKHYRHAVEVAFEHTTTEAAMQLNIDMATCPTL
jgi:integrase